ncbi:hypothetical protein, partial [Pseudomonas sp. MPR-R2A4]|uniref:hypothetical protein n=1 Tax=Pseudomonas sp. MPR-R2A4 TaxID=2070620 RepID=UPI000CA844B1
EQYIRLVQALLVNLNDVLVIKKEEEGLLEEIEKVLLFIQNFFYQYFDFEYRVSAYCEKQLQDNIYLKLSYWKIKLHDSPLIDV